MAITNPNQIKTPADALELLKALARSNWQVPDKKVLALDNKIKELIAAIGPHPQSKETQLLVTLNAEKVDFRDWIKLTTDMLKSAAERGEVNFDLIGIDPSDPGYAAAFQKSVAEQAAASGTEAPSFSVFLSLIPANTPLNISYVRSRIKSEDSRYHMLLCMDRKEILQTHVNPLIMPQEQVDSMQERQLRAEKYLNNLYNGLIIENKLSIILSFFERVNEAASNSAANDATSSPTATRA